MANIDFNLLARAIRAKRKQTGQLQQEVASLVGISRSTMSRLEKGTFAADTNNVLKICRWLHVPLESFVNEEPERLVLYPDQDSLSVVMALIERDDTIEPADKPRLFEIFSTAYAQLKNRTRRPEGTRRESYMDGV